MQRSDTTEERLEALLAAMDRRAKIRQLQVTFRPDPDEAKDLARAGIGALFWPMSAEATNALQRCAVEESAHGIPLLVGLDVIHGHRTIFPIPLAQAASFDPAVAEADGRVSGAEAASAGVNWAYSPMVDVTRDARWGRVCEGYGEDPFLVGEFGAAKVLGFQGDSLTAPGAVAACGKHFVGYGAAEAGRDYNTTDLSERTLRDTYLPPFRRLVDAGVASLMASFNAVAGRPVHAHRGLLTGVVKDEWGFDGAIVGDADGVRNLIAHGVAGDMTGARRLAFGAGLDIEMDIAADLDELDTDLGPEGLDGARLDDAVRRLLRLKFALGLFENPYVDPTAEILDAPAAHRAEARAVAARCAVLLKNDGTLPLAPPRVGRSPRVLIVGPYAASADHLGAWVQHTGAAATSLADELAALRTDLDIVTVPGLGFLADEPGARDRVAAEALGADLVIVAVGEPSDLSGEASSRADIRLPGDQESLIHAVADTGTPFAVVLIHGRPLVVADWIDRAPAVLAAGHLGTEGAGALADLLTGAANPAGRLPMTWPRAVGQLPAYYNHENTGRPATSGGRIEPRTLDVALDGPANLQDFFTSKYRDLALGPQFGFGHGLSYADFAHADTALAAGTVPLDDLRGGTRIAVSTIVTNTSAVDGDEVVLVFVRDLVASLAQPVRRLVAFRRVPVPAGASVAVVLDFGHDELAFWADDGAGHRVETGAFEVLVGPRPDDLSILTLTVT